MSLTASTLRSPSIEVKQGHPGRSLTEQDLKAKAQKLREACRLCKQSWRSDFISYVASQAVSSNNVQSSDARQFRIFPGVICKDSGRDADVGVPVKRCSLLPIPLSRTHDQPSS